MPPLVTAVMVTGKNPARNPLALAAVECFRRQTWVNRELVIINDGTPLGVAGDNIREISRKPHATITLGDLRNAGLDAAKGDWVIQWDDDDWYHPDRITQQMLAADGRAVLLRHQIRYDAVDGMFYTSLGMPAHAGTILHPRRPMARYFSERKHEDSHFWQQWFPDAVRLANDPELYLRISHGTNTWGRDHIIRAPVRGRAAQVVPPGVQLERLRAIVRNTYAFLPLKAG